MAINIISEDADTTVYTMFATHCPECDAWGTPVATDYKHDCTTHVQYECGHTEWNSPEV